MATARLSYCVVERADNGGGKDAVFVDDCRIKMDNCTVRQNALCGVCCEGADGYFGDFSNNTVTTSGECPVRIEADKVRTLGTDNVLTAIPETGSWSTAGTSRMMERG
jgi:hypothetical protein